MSLPAGGNTVATLAATVAGLDWQQPWLAPWRAEAPGLLAQLNAGQSVVGALNALNALNTHDGGSFEDTLLRAPVRFVAQSELPAGQAYEHFIFETRQVPTRDNLHDLFNGLCWLQFPQTKRRLNALQAEQIAVGGVLPTRGAVRDALTVFDENSALLMAPKPLWDALLARQWQRLFIELRPLWREARLVLFGHALLEKLAHPRKSITAHVYLGMPDISEMSGPGALESPGSLDRWVASDLSAAKLAGKPFAPLQVLGVPGWWADNENFSFYDDSDIFRPAKR
ncbi:MAG: DUF3025 domain-containing protein [Polaromonas sp.]|nr:DUF3025 domain-containing protein [Polaromonas sp.]